MRVEFHDSATVTPEWNGNQDLPKEDQFTVTMTPLSTNDLIDLLDVLAAMEIDESEMSNVDMNQAAKIIKATQDLIPRYCTINELFTPHGASIDASVVVSDARFMTLAVELFASLMAASQTIASVTWPKARI